LTVSILPSQNSYSSPPYFLLACLASTLPIWLATYPPMLDIPIHAVQIATFLRLLSGTEHFESLFRINWFTPYWSGYLITALWGLFLPISTAIKCTLSMAVAATPWAASRLRSLVNKNSYFDWLFLPIGYGFAFQWGFLNYIIGIPLTLLFLEYSIRYLAAPRLKTGIIIFIWAHLLFITHILLLLFSLSIIISIEALTSKKFQKSINTLIPILLSIPTIIIWFIYTRSIEPQTSSPISWVITPNRLIAVFITPAGCFSFWAIALICFSVILKPPPLPKMNIFKHWQTIPLLYAFLITLYGPSLVFGTAYLCERFGAFLLPFYAFAYKDKENESTSFNKKNHLVLCPIFAFIIIAINSYESIKFESELTGLRKIIRIMEPNKKLISLIYDYNNPSHITPILLHTPSWYFAEKGGLGNRYYSTFNMIIRYKKNAPTTVSDIQKNIQWEPQSFNWNQDGKYYDYFILHGDISKYHTVYEGIKNLHLLYTDGKWWLYARNIPIDYSKPLNNLKKTIYYSDSFVSPTPQEKLP